MESFTWIRILVFAITLLPFHLSWGTVYMTVPQALDKVAPPKARLVKKTVFLTTKEKSSLEEKLKFKISSKMIPLVQIFEGDKLFGTAYIDTHQVRKENETLMVVVSPTGIVKNIEVLSFNEPPDYLPKDSWLAQFYKLRASDLHKKKTGVLEMVGATLTSDSIEKSVLKIVAISKLNA